jgi:hypothetical protein
MTRIFTTLATIDGLLLLAGFGIGILSKLGVAEYMLHFWLGLSAALVTLLVHCLVFTYFLGTGRWVKEVALAYRLPDEPLPRLTRELKRQTFPPALFAMLIAIATAAAGTAAQLQEWPWPVHATLATLTLLINFWAFAVEYRNVNTNAGVIERVLSEVDRLRAERGLPTNQAALQQEVL